MKVTPSKVTPPESEAIEEAAAFEKVPAINPEVVDRSKLCTVDVNESQDVPLTWALYCGDGPCCDCKRFCTRLKIDYREHHRVSILCHGLTCLAGVCAVSVVVTAIVLACITLL
eukprot:SAG31_NODE_1039_length_10212_cov_8.897063_2_plen_114_part_00